MGCGHGPSSANSLFRRETARRLADGMMPRLSALRLFFLSRILYPLPSGIQIR
jgi:hypothetical protein